MRKEELLKPRYKVIADWPLNTAFKVGEICDRNWEFEIGNLKTSCNDYPHLFKRLEWYEDRKPEDLPEYVKYKSLTTQMTVVVKVNRWNTDDGLVTFNHTPIWHKNVYHPATKEEYEQYLKQITSDGK